MPGPVGEERRAPGDDGWRVPTPVRVVIAVLALAVAAHTVSLVPGVRDLSPRVPVVGGWVENAVWPLCGLLAVLRVVGVRAERTAWAVLTAALLAGCGASLYYYGYLASLPVVPFPSAADVSWAVMYPTACAGLLLLLRARVGTVTPAMGLDALLAAFAGGAVAALLILGLVPGAGADGLLPTLVGLAYPVGDLVLLLLVLAVFGLFGWRPGRAWAALGAGFAVQVVSDTAFAVATVSGTWHEGTLLDAGWPVAYFLMTVSAWQRPQRHVPRPTGVADLLTPSALAVAALVVLLVGSVRHVPLLVSLLAFGGVLVGIARVAVTFHQVRGMPLLRAQARTDELTGLPNRRWFTEELTAALDGAQDADLSVLLVDLNRFKEVNDGLGHAAGDALLQEVGQRFDSRLRDGDLLARLGGDEFAVLLRGVDAAAAEELAARLAATLAEPVLLSGVRVHVGASIGVAGTVDASRPSGTPPTGTQVTGPPLTAAELLRRADVAMYRAKADRSGTHRYAEALDAPGRDRLRLVDELRTGIAAGELVVHYQPKIALASGRATGCEALVRWLHPDHGLMGPDTFLPLVQDAGLGPVLTDTVLDAALRECARWRRGDRELSVAVNLTTPELLDTQLPARVAAALARHGLPGSALVLEITEGVFLVDRATSVTVLRDLRRRGVRVSIDDYGTGYSSLAYLRELPLDELKLDRAFVADLDGDPRAAAIVESTVRLAHSLGLAMVAEGVETTAVRDRLRSYGCDLAQGYGISRPLGADDVARFLAPTTDDRAPAPPTTGVLVPAAGA